jgi:hypothetical protein
MSNPTTPFGWQMPTNTDLVTDLPADFEVFGQAVATSMSDLLGGTTGQILSKATNADMDFTWVSANPGDITGVTAGTGISGGGTSGDVTITNAMATAIDAKGDLIAGTAADAFARLAIGTNDQVLTADSSTATGMKWATASGGSAPAFQAYLGSNQSGSDSVAMKLNINTEVFDTDSWYDTSTYRYTPQKAGYYQFTIRGSSPIIHTIYIYKNNSTQFLAIGYNSFQSFPGSSMLYMNGTSDYVELWGLVQTAASTFTAGASNTSFEGFWVRP